MTETTAQQEQPKANGASQKKKRYRSPSYPAINLEESLTRAQTIWQHERKNVAPLEAVMGHWGYKAKSSSGLLAAAAMKKFGLLVEVDGSKERQVRLSELALNILLDEREDSVERAAHIKDAAMKPALHREFWAKWGAELPSDATIRTYLVKDRGFTQSSAQQALDIYRQSLSFARVQSGDTIANGGQDDEEDGDDPLFDQASGRQGSAMQAVIDNLGNKDRQPPPPPPGHKPPPPPSGQKDFPLYLSNNQRAVLYVPAVMSVKDYELLKRQIENHLMVIEATSVNPDEPKQ